MPDSAGLLPWNPVANSFGLNSLSTEARTQVLLS